MKIHQTRWSALRPLLEIHAQLSPQSRSWLLQMKGATSVDGDGFGEDLAALVEAGVLRFLANGERVVLEPATRPLLTALRAAGRCDVLEAEAPAAMVRYVQESYTGALRDELLFDELYVYGDKARRVAARAKEVEWVERMLESRMCKEWKRAHAHGYSGVEHVYTPAIRALLEKLVVALVERGEPVPAGELADLVGSTRPANLDRLFEAALRYLVVFPGLQPETGRFVIGLAPRVMAYRSRAPVAEPETLDVALEPVPAYGCADLQQLLVTIAGSHVRLRADKSLFKRDADLLAAALQPRGPLADLLLSGSPPERVEDALQAARGLGFVVDGPDAGGRTRLVATDAARQWLGQDSRARLQFVVDRMGPTAHADPAAEEDWLHDAGIGAGWLSVLGKAGFVLSYDSPKLPLVEACLEMLRRLPRAGGIDLAALATHESRERNPLLGQGPYAASLERVTSRYGDRLTREKLETIWSAIVLDAVAELLAIWGGLQCVLVGAENPDTARLLVGLTPIGAYALGLEADMPLLEEAAARVIVQPTFEVVFLDPAPEAEAELAAFCERMGSGVGIVFRITKASILQAAAAGMTADTILAALERVSSEALPGNVRAEIKAWHGRQRVLALERPWILRCGDAETAARALAAAPGKLERLSEDVLAVRGRTRPETVAKLLAAHGITLDTSKVPVKKKRAAPRRRSYRRRYW